MSAVSDLLKELYTKYRRAPSIEEKSTFFSVHCGQICDPYPSYGAQDRETIVRYLKESAIAESGIDVIDRAVKSSTETTKGYYTIRPVTADEHDFGKDEGARSAGFDSAEAVQEKSRREEWMGMRVDLWSDNGTNVGGIEDGLLVKVRYWWKKEGDTWVQILHHIIYLGPRDGTEESQGEVLE